MFSTAKVEYGDNSRALVLKLCQLDEQIKELTQLRNDLKAEVSEILLDAGPKSVDNYTVEMKTVPGANRFDKKKAEAAGIDLSPYYTKGKPSVRLTIKVGEKL